MIGVHLHESPGYLAEIGDFVVKDCDCCDEDEHKIEGEGREEEGTFALDFVYRYQL